MANLKEKARAAKMYSSVKAVPLGRMSAPVSAPCVAAAAICPVQPTSVLPIATRDTMALVGLSGKNPEAWAKGLKHEDFELLCPDGTRKPLTEAQDCHLGIVPNHAVVSRRDKAEFVRRVLFNQQELFGRNRFAYVMFQLFKSSTKDLLFSDDTQCLANLQDKTTYEKYLGREYLMAIDNLRQCLASELLDACTFHGN